MDKGKQIGKAIDAMPDILSHDEIVATLLTVAQVYAEDDISMMAMFADCVSMVADKMAGEGNAHKSKMN